MALSLASFASGGIALAAGFVFTFLVPGLAFQRFFSLKPHEKWAFVPIFSVLFSVVLIYFLSLAFGYSATTIVSSFLVLTAIYSLVVFRWGQPFAPKSILKIKQVKKTSLLLFVIVFLVSMAILYRTVWYSNTSGIVLTGVNWQDTPFHYEIIESINQGNFPPQTPNYVGTPLSYHYFVDFHTAILENVYGYLPTLLPVLNAVFAVVFALSMYALGRSYGRRVAIIATIIGVFGWGFAYFGLFNALLTDQFNPGQGYLQYKGFFGLPSIYDNLLQQRPMLVGLPAFALVLSLLKDMDDNKRLILAGIVTGLVYQFNNVAFFCCYVAYTAALLFSLRKFRFSYLYFLIPTALALPFILFSGSTFNMQISVVWIAEFAQNPFIFYFANLGIPFILAIVSFIKVGSEYLKATMLFLILIPNVLLLTPNPWDMYKFFIFAWVPIATIFGVMLAKKRKIIVFTLVLFSILTTASVISYNFGTNYTAATWDEYNVGMWVRDNTPENSVFLTASTIHAPTSLIGGRLRVTAYVNWPYGHGIPLSDISERQSEVDMAYNGTSAQLASVAQKYNVSYIYVGYEEARQYPNCTVHFNSISWLNQTYQQNSLRIYQIDWAAMTS